MSGLLTLPTLGLVVATAVLTGLTTGRRPFAIASWLAPLPALLLMQTLSPPAAALAIGSAMFAGTAWRNRGIIPLPPPAFYATMAVQAAAGVLPFLAHGFAGPVLAAPAAALVLPAAIVALEYLSASGNPFGTWGSLAYSQRRNLPLLQLAAATGLWGITFLTVWPAAAVGVAVERGLSDPGTQAGIAIAFAAVVAAHVGGWLRLRRTAFSATPPVTVAALSRPPEAADQATMERLLTADLADPDLGEAATVVFHTLHELLLEETARAAEDGAQLVVWPEADAPVLAEHAPVLVERIQQHARQHHVHVLAGIAAIDPTNGRFDNHIVLVDATGHVVARYRKAKLVPGFEMARSEPGESDVPVTETALGRIAAAICFDLDFPDHIRTAGKQNADLLLVPASDWPDIAELHADMAAFRAVENGVTLVRSARWGRSTVATPDGREVAAVDHVRDAGRRLSAIIRPTGRPTLYARIGDVVAVASTAATVVAVVAAVLVRLTS